MQRTNKGDASVRGTRSFQEMRAGTLFQECFRHRSVARFVHQNLSGVPAFRFKIILRTAALLFNLQFEKFREELI